MPIQPTTYNRSASTWDQNTLLVLVHDRTMMDSEQMAGAQEGGQTSAEFAKATRDRSVVALDSRMSSNKSMFALSEFVCKLVIAMVCKALKSQSSPDEKASRKEESFKERWSAAERQSHWPIFEEFER
ncbi:hypothetical protein AC578_257 [Pseudocercospora eumusae]|uniref:Uncharacterized protein n=1 Tax=Pseudocercospora eumusae TaxID=321146 RepID=A0A139HIX6_9PEZI|nr:hypothetical protein AC578_257 [Pseudocercospora eumusae]